MYYNSGHTEIKAINPLYKGINTPDDLYNALMHCWTKETCTERLRNKYNDGNKTAGQCAITAFLVQDIFGGEIREMDTGRGLHCYNVINGIAIDLTSEQFGADAAKLNYENNPLQPDRELRMSQNQKRERYELLIDNLKEYLEIKNAEFVISTGVKNSVFVLNKCFSGVKKNEKN